MDEVHPKFPNDAELNTAMASNYFQLAQPAKARKYARLALAADPTDRRMSFLIKASWVMYFPPFYFISVVLLLFYGLDALIGRIPTFLILLPLFFIFADFFNIFQAATFILIGAKPPLGDTLLWLGWCVVYLAATAPAIYNFISRRSKTVSLKKY